MAVSRWTSILVGACGGLVALAVGGNAAASSAPLRATHAPTRQQYVVVLRDGAPQASSLAAAGIGRSAVRQKYHSVFNGYAASLSSSDAATLRREPGVRMVAPARRFHATATPPIKTIPQVTTRSMRRIGAPDSAARSGNGKGQVPRINVAIIDSGIQPNQPDLRVAGGVNCSSEPGGYADPQGHGTEVAGIVAAEDNAFGIVGVAPGARLWAVRMLDSNLEADDPQLLCALDWVTSTRLDNNPHNDIAVANMSFAGPGRDDGHCGHVDHDVVHMAVCRAVKAGVTFVAGAGNDDADVAHVAPASYREVLTATGITDGDGAPGGLTPDPCLSDPDDRAAPFSNFATHRAALAHLVAAPAVCVSTTYIGGDVAVDSGTSFAAPHVTGIVALCIAYRDCAGLRPRGIVRKIVLKTDMYNLHHRHYGFVGDPLRPHKRRIYGFLVAAPAVAPK